MHQMKRPPAITLPLTGHCQCGQVQFTVNTLPLTFYACHCRECQKQSASAFGLSLVVPEAAFKCEGEVKTWSRPTDSGGEMQCHYCPDCGTRLWHESGRPHPVHGQILSVKAGAIRQMDNHEPVGHIWISSRRAGGKIPAVTIRFEKSPDNPQSLINAWQDYIAALA